MNKLFVIGNYFDVKHGLPTRYTDFRDYLLKRINYNYRKVYGVPSVSVAPDGEVYANEEETICFIVDVIDSYEKHRNEEFYSWDEIPEPTWSALEEYLGRPELYELFNEQFDITSEYFSDSNDDLVFRSIHNNEDLSADIGYVFGKTKELFEEWVREELYSLDYSCVSPVFSNIIDKESLYLTFNYTKTLEQVYGVNAGNVCHLHGAVDSNGDIYFGHGDDEELSFPESIWGIDSAIMQLKENLRKNTNKALNDNLSFFNKLSTITDVYPFGFSFSDVDMIYVQKILQSTSNNCKWHLCKYDWEKEPEKAEKLKALGIQVDYVLDWENYL